MTAVFRVVNWAPNELIAEDKMDQLSNNSQWLFDNTPRALYTTNKGVRRSTGLKLAGGVAVFAPSKYDTATQTVTFGGFFSVGCMPLITTGVNSIVQHRVFATINGISTTLPDNTGFKVILNVAADQAVNDHIATTTYVFWQGLGY